MLRSGLQASAWMQQAIMQTKSVDHGSSSAAQRQRAAQHSRRPHRGRRTQAALRPARGTGLRTWPQTWAAAPRSQTPVGSCPARTTKGSRGEGRAVRGRAVAKAAACHKRVVVSDVCRPTCRPTAAAAASWPTNTTLGRQAQGRPSCAQSMQTSTRACSTSYELTSGMSWPSSRSNFSGVSLFRMPLTCGHQKREAGTGVGGCGTVAYQAELHTNANQRVAASSIAHSC